jgi:hypothetical protein
MAQRTASTTLQLDNAAVAGALDDTSVVNGNSRVNQIAAQSPQPREDAVFVGPREARIADYIRAKDRRKFPGLAHRASPPPPD